MPKYRIPLFGRLAERPGLDVRVVYASIPGLSNAEPEGFRATHVPMWQQKLLGRDLWWHEETEKSPNYIAPESMNSEDQLFLLYTSGSTGKP